ncbi:MAG: MMPL family transporter [archaeon]
MGKFKKIFTNWRVIILIVCLVFSIVAINPSFEKQGVTIRSVVKNSSASDAGFESLKPNIPPRQRELILSVNNIPITNVSEYTAITSDIPENQSISIRTNKKIYLLTTRAAYRQIVLNETELVNVTEEVFNEELNTTENVTTTHLQNKTELQYLGVEDIGLRIDERPANNIRRGLDLVGGTRVLLKPEEDLSEEDMNTLIDNMKQRLNIYGLSDVTLRQVTDKPSLLIGQVNRYVLVEIAGSNVEEVKDLLAKQGKFESHIGQNTVFKGGNKDITYVCRSAQCSGLFQACTPDQNGEWACRFQFSITLSPDAAQRQADLTRNLSVEILNGEGFLSQNLTLWLDDEQVDELRIGESLRGRAETNIQITGSGTGKTQYEAQSDALQNMKRLQTILITGSLPVKLEITKTDTISPVLGESFSRNILLIGLLAMIAVTLVIFIRYRNPVIVLPVIITLVSELVILLGLAALIGWNLDLVAIAGILVAVGTGVDDQIVIVDETLRKEFSYFSNWKEKLKNAFFIIFASYFTLVVAMFPLMFAGAGLLKGFAITTILGVTIGVFITRPAFAAMLENLIEK